MTVWDEEECTEQTTRRSTMPNTLRLVPTCTCEPVLGPGTCLGLPLWNLGNVRAVGYTGTTADDKRANAKGARKYEGMKADDWRSDKCRRRPQHEGESLVTLWFRDEKGYVLYPQIGDRLDLICPPLDTARSTPDYEFYKLYLVSSREQADRCEVTGPPNIVLTCDEPTRERRFTIKFQEFSPNLWGHEFKSMHDYYIIDVSQSSSSPSSSSQAH
ncbi:EPH-related receptor transmembrane ligand ELK-L3 [Takifugu flavidus]|uniref:EPH-related receptor transmembrane ligand ELK-L3 n=1 Tax=Takifugu flavidus TaxID=433684 RepID=A0A5C6NA66_9TELE|nr:EPH-related receptor transmembrane ligand ELK-L3 [Takifugu flavidus]